MGLTIRETVIQLAERGDSAAIEEMSAILARIRSSEVIARQLLPNIFRLVGREFYEAAMAHCQENRTAL